MRLVARARIALAVCIGDLGQWPCSLYLAHTARNSGLTSTMLCRHFGASGVRFPLAGHARVKRSRRVPSWPPRSAPANSSSCTVRGMRYPPRKSTRPGPPGGRSSCSLWGGRAQRHPDLPCSPYTHSCSDHIAVANDILERGNVQN